MASNLETPDRPDAIYTAIGEDVDIFRPVFTGDVYTLPDGRRVMIIQHPCALRRGTNLIDRLLVAEVSQSNRLPEDWAAGHFKIMPLPGLLGSSLDFSANFINLDLISSDELTPQTRVASLSLVGVNLLLQRWVHHNSRVVIPTITYSEQTIGPFEEADLAADWCMERESLELPLAMKEFDEWIRESVGGETRQAMLTNNQKRSVVRRDMRKKLKEFSSMT